MVCELMLFDILALPYVDHIRNSLSFEKSRFREKNYRFVFHQVKCDTPDLDTRITLHMLIYDLGELFPS